LAKCGRATTRDDEQIGFLYRFALTPLGINGVDW